MGLLPLSFAQKKEAQRKRLRGLGAVCFVKNKLDETAHAPFPLKIP